MIIRLLIYYRFVNTIKLDKVCFNHEHRAVTGLFMIVLLILLNGIQYAKKIIVLFKDEFTLPTYQKFLKN